MVMVLFPRSRRFSALACVAVLLCLSISVSALEPSTYMRSSSATDLLSQSILEASLNSEPMRPSTGLEYIDASVEYNTVEFRFSFQSTVRFLRVYVTLETNLSANDARFLSIWFAGNSMHYEGPSTIPGLHFYSVTMASAPPLPSYSLAINALGASGVYFRLVDVTGLDNTNSTLSVGSALRTYVSASSTRYEATPTSMAYKYNLSYTIPGSIVLNYSGAYITATTTIIYPITAAGRPDFLSFRFYAPSTHYEVPAESPRSPVPVASSPVISVSIGFASDVASTSAVPGATIYESASNLNYFGTHGCVCYDVSADLTNVGIEISGLSYYYLTVVYHPYSVSGSPISTLNFALQFNGGATGFYPSEDDDLAQWTQWYYGFASEKYNGAIATFTEYMDKLLGLFGAVPDVSQAYQDVEENRTAEQEAVSAGSAAAGDVIASATLPVPVIGAFAPVAAVSGFLSDGFGLTLLSCLVLVPLSVGIISKLLNGGD